MRTALLLSVFALHIAGCNKSAEQSGGSAGTAPSTKPSASVASARIESLLVQSSSPDQTVKSWWRYLDLVELENIASCNKASAEQPPAHLRYLAQIADSELLSYKTPKAGGCVLDSFSRDIDEVKTESETRAIVYATIRNATAVPPGAEADEQDKKWRTAGFKYKYLVERTNGAWKISQVYKYDEVNKYLKKDVWEKLYELSTGPRYPAFVGQQ